MTAIAKPPKPHPANLTRLAALLADLGARHVGRGDVDPDEFPFDPTRVEELAQGPNFVLRHGWGDLDVIQWSAAGRPRDLDDLRRLGAGS